ncbi:hypothetical protein [Streptomyces huasconensis]|uniref:hypothetical protein n=1 Tax=Streptomyces huasconensis TaxID=1854574 RepID=UPI002E7BED9F|nr:hypothetical protein [Streptomyces huasconensis]
MSTPEVPEVHEPPELAAVGRPYDGNHTSGTGCPALHGLGTVGGGAHADHEHVIVAEMVPRIRLLAALVEEHVR